MTPAGERTAVSAGGIRMSVELQRFEVRVPTPDGGEVIVDPRQHREDVVRRLRQRGVSVATLVRLLPEWEPLITRVAAGRGSPPTNGFR